MNAINSTEILRLARTDFGYYAPRALKIRSKAGNMVPFIMNRAQQHLHEQIELQKRSTGKVRVLGLKGRQQGFSTYVEGRFYWKVSGEFGKRAFILTHLAEATNNLFGMTQRYHDNCPEAFRPSTKNQNTTALVFDKLQSEFSVATAGSKGTGRSATAQYFHGSEAAWWPNAEEHMAGIGQIVPDEPGTEIILESTGNGIGGMFHGMWEDAERGRGDYLAVFVPWFWQEEYRAMPPADWTPPPEQREYGQAFGLDLMQMYWRWKKIVTDFRNDASLFDQEYPATPALAFRRDDAATLISAQRVLRARKTKDAEARGAKIMGVDVAEYGDDDTAIACRQGRVVLPIERRHGLGPMEVAGLVARRIDAWQPDAVNVDCTGVGSGVADRLLEMGYSQVNRVHFGERAIEGEQYGLRGDEMWGEFNAWLDDIPNSLPDDDVLERDLTGRRYGYDSSRRLRLESKEQMKKRGLKSPDSADAVALTFAMPVSATVQKVDHGRRTNWRS